MKKKKEPKKDYKSPKMKVINLHHRTQLLDGSDCSDGDWGMCIHD